MDGGWHCRITGRITYCIVYVLGSLSYSRPLPRYFEFLVFSYDYQPSKLDVVRHCRHGIIVIDNQMRLRISMFKAPQLINSSKVTQLRNRPATTLLYHATSRRYFKSSALGDRTCRHLRQPLRDTSRLN